MPRKVESELVEGEVNDQNYYARRRQLQQTQTRNGTFFQNITVDRLLQPSTLPTISDLQASTSPPTTSIPLKIDGPLHAIGVHRTGDNAACLTSAKSIKKQSPKLYISEV